MATDCYRCIPVGRFGSDNCRLVAVAHDGYRRRRTPLPLIALFMLVRLEVRRILWRFLVVTSTLIRFAR